MHRFVDSVGTLNRGVQVSSGDTDYWAGEFNGGKYGIITTGTEMALGADGPAFISRDLIVGGIAQKPGGGTWAVWSDRRLKKEVTQFRTGLEAIEQVQPVRFKYNGLGGTADSNQEYVGVIAQDLEPVAPYMVTSEKKKLKPTDQALSDIKSVDPNAFTYMLINAVQELSQRDKELTQRNKDLTALVCQDHPTAALCRSSGKLAQKKSGLQQGLAQRVE